MSRLVLGLDFGSDSVRALILDAQDGRELGVGTCAYPRWAEGRFCDPAAHRFRQHPDDHLEAMTTAVHAAVAACGCTVAEIAGIGVDTTGSSPLPLAQDGRALALHEDFATDPDACCILWKDHTAQAEAEAITAAARAAGGPDYTTWSGGIYSSEWFWAKIWHVVAGNERVRAAAHTWIECCDWIPAVLCGIDDPSAMPRSRCAAGHKALWHPDWGGLPPAAFLDGLHPALGELRARLYTGTHTADQRAGALCPVWADRLGLEAGIAVAVGAFDAHLGAVGAGATPGSLIKVMGTSTCDMMVAEPAALAGRAIPGICGQVDGSILPGLVGIEAGQSAFGDAYAWFARLLGWPLERLATAGPELRAAVERQQAQLLPELGAAAAQLPLGGETIALDWFNGRRTPDASARARAALAGLHLGSDAPALFRAIVEATACGARAIADRISGHGVPIERVLALGGIARKAPFVMQVHADVLGRPIDVVASDECCARGSAIAASVAAGLHPDLPSAVARLASPLAEAYRPDPATQAAADRLYERYRALGQALDTEHIAP